MARNNIQIRFDQGYVSARDETELQPGELTAASGAYYKIGDPARVWKEDGRSSFHQVQTSGEVKGMALCLFDANTAGSGFQSDILVSYINDELYWVNPDDASSSGTLLSGTGYTFGNASKLYSVHDNDKWYLSNGIGRPIVVEGDGTIRRMGMLPPLQAPIISGAIKASGLYRPSTNTSGYGVARFKSGYWEWEYITYYYWPDDINGFTGEGTMVSSFEDTDNVTDSSLTTYAYGTVDDQNNWITSHWFSGFTGAAASGNYLKLRYQVVPGGAADTGGGDIGVGTSLGDAGVQAEISVIWSGQTISGTYYPALPVPGTAAAAIAPIRGRHLIYEDLTEAMVGVNTVTTELPADVAPSSCMVHVQLRQRAFQQDAGLKPVVIRLHDIRMTSGIIADNKTSTDGFKYMLTEYDEFRGLESVPSEPSELFTMSDNAGAFVTLPTSTRNTNTTHYKVYRSAEGEYAAWNYFGLVGQTKSSDTKFIDDYTEWPTTSQPVPLIPNILVYGDDQTATSYLRDGAPGPMKALTAYQGSIAGIDAQNPRGIIYSYAGYPESFPGFHVISAIPLKERDELVGLSTVGKVLIILAKGAVLVTEQLPHARRGSLEASDIKVLEGAPGCVGEYAYTALGIDGYPGCAYVAIHGIYICDGDNVTNISEDLDWDSEVNRSTLSSSVLFYDKSQKHLIFVYDKDGDGVNDHYFIFHLARIHRKQNGLPKITGPTPGKITQLVQGQISNAYKIFSGHTTNGYIYQERTGTADDSEASTNGLIKFDVRTGKIYGDWNYWTINRGNLRHTDWGSQTVTLTHNWGRDDSGYSGTKDRTVSVAGNRGHEVTLNRNAEWHQLEISHATSGQVGGIHHLALKAKGNGPAGNV